MTRKLRLLGISALTILLTAAHHLNPWAAPATPLPEDSNNDDFPDSLGTGGGGRVRQQLKATLAIAKSQGLSKALHRLHSTENPLKPY